MGNKKTVILENIKNALSGETLSHVDYNGQNINSAFKVIVGNPPYQDDTNPVTVSIYPYFLETVQKLSESVSLIYPFKWVVTGNMTFRNREINSRHYQDFYVHSGSSDVFSSANISGGINYFLWVHKQREKSNKMRYVYDSSPMLRDNLIAGLPAFLADNLHLELINKISPKNLLTVSPRTPYGLPSAVTTAEIKSWDRSGSLDIVVRGGKILSIEETVFEGITQDYKVFSTKSCSMSKTSNGFRRVDRIFVGYPNQICSGTYLKIGSYDTEQEAINTVRYLKTDFVNFLISILSISQNSPRGVYKFVPDVDFATGEIIDKKGVFLDFNQPETLDQQLAAIYGLTVQEVNLIENCIKPWADKINITAQDNK